MVNTDFLVGASEIATRLGGTRRQLVHEWRRRHPEFPEPILEVERTLIWDWREVSAWAERTGRLEPVKRREAKN